MKTDSIINIVVFGPQGSGKGTQSEKLSEKYGLFHLSLGDQLRLIVKSNTKKGKEIGKLINAGKLVSDKIVNDIILDIKKHSAAKHGIIFDGYPRRLTHYNWLKNHFKIDAAIDVHISDSESIHRINSRRVCPECRHNYNTIFLKPKKIGICDFCKTKLVHRADDKPEFVKKRLAIYHKSTEPLRAKYKKDGLLYIIDGSKPIKEVNQDINKVIDKIIKDKLKK